MLVGSHDADVTVILLLICQFV